MIIKTHPQETILPYKKYKNNSVFLTDISVDLLLKKADLHLQSTVLLHLMRSNTDCQLILFITVIKVITFMKFITQLEELY